MSFLPIQKEKDEIDDEVASPDPPLPHKPPHEECPEEHGEMTTERTGVFSRRQLIQEFLSSEEVHVQNLHFLLQNYLLPIRQGSILPLRDIQSLFCNLELIFNWHSNFLAAIKVHTQTGDTLGDVFIEMMPVLRQLYIQYNENYDHAIQTYEQAKKNKLFSQLLEKAPETNKDLLSYLYLPIQRMISYSSLLKDLIEATPTHHEDYDYLCFALEAIRLASAHGQNRADHRKNIDKVLQIQESLSDGRSIAVPHRKFIMEDDVLCYEKGRKGELEKERRLFLFNDLLLVTKRKKDNKFHIKAVEPLETLMVEDHWCNEDQFRFRVESSSASYLFSSEKKALWLSHMTDAVKQCKRARYKHAQLQPTEGDQGDGKRPLHTFEESSREYLITRILRWARMEDAEDVHSEVQTLALVLEKYLAVDSV